MSKSDIIFYTASRSRSSIVKWMLEELKVPYETKVLEYGDQMKSPPYTDINPMGKVPAIVHNSKVVTECAAICAYLADAFPSKKLAPPVGERADYYRWFFFAAGPLEAAIVNNFLGVTVPKEHQSTVGYGNFDLTIKTLAKAVLKHKYLAADYFTAADVYVGANIAFGLQFKTIPREEAFVAYTEKITSRPAYIKISKELQA